VFPTTRYGGGGGGFFWGGGGGGGGGSGFLFRRLFLPGEGFGKSLNLKWWSLVEVELMLLFLIELDLLLLDQIGCECFLYVYVKFWKMLQSGKKVRIVEHRSADGKK